MITKIMTYELAKQLKNAGFPQVFDVGKKFYAEKDAKFGNIQNILLTDDKISIPSLSELIEACGDGFRDLCFHPDGFFISDGSKKWNTNRDDLWHCELPPSTSPEEAVANLYLQINSKK